jgi:hypothetical protein
LFLTGVRALARDGRFRFVDAMSVLRPGDTAWPALRLSVPAEERFDDLFGQSGLLEPDPHTWFTAGADAVNGDDATSK